MRSSNAMRFVFLTCCSCTLTTNIQMIRLRRADRRGHNDPMDKDLLAVASLLAWTEQAVPKHAMMRRAVSTAYYALFHALADRCAKTLVTSSGSDWDTFTLVYRALDHASAKRFFEMRDVERFG